MLYLLLPLVIATVVMGYALRRERHRHEQTRNALRFWRRYQGKECDEPR
jgi:hypothetical protein